jgi:glucan-binding YG repeat protein
LNGTFYAEIRSGDERIRLGTFETAHEAARAYDAVAWRLGRSRRSMNFNDVSTRQQAEMLAPPPLAVTREQRERELEQRLLIAERDERLRLEWAQQFPEDVAVMEAFYAEKAEEKAAVKAAKKADREERRAKSAARKKEREEKATRKAARKKEEKKNGAGSSTITVSSSSSFDWTSTPVSSTTLSSSLWDFEE